MYLIIILILFLLVYLIIRPTLYIFFTDSEKRPKIQPGNVFECLPPESEVSSLPEYKGDGVPIEKKFDTRTTNIFRPWYDNWT